MRNVALFTILATVLHFSTQTCNKKTINVGTTLFSESDLLKNCWSSERITLLTYRMVLEDILPSIDVLHAKGEEFVIEIVDYFKLVLEVVRRISDANSKHLMLLALSDLLGGYLNYAVLPIAKYAYYAGNLNYENTEELYELFDELKCFLRTSGEGWEKPMTITSDQLDVKPLPAETPNAGVDPCKGLIYYEHPPDEIRKESGQTSHCSYEIPMPFLDSKSHPSAIAVPFKTFSLRNLESKASAYVLVKFYMAAHKCLAYKKAEPSDITVFDNRFFTWINHFVIGHLPDEKLYSAFGGVLRVYMSLKNRGGQGGNKEIGNYNVMPEVEEKEPVNELEGGIVTEQKEKKNYGRLILYTVLAVLLFWFLLGAIFICYKIRKRRASSGEAACNTCCSDGKFNKISTSWPKLHKKSSGPSAKSDKKSKSAGDIPKKTAASTASSVKSEKKTKQTREFPSLKFGSLFLCNKNEKKTKSVSSPKIPKKAPCEPPATKIEKKAKSVAELPPKPPISTTSSAKSEKKAQSAIQLPTKPSSTKSEKKARSATELPAKPSSVKSEKSSVSTKPQSVFLADTTTSSTTKSVSSFSKDQTTPSVTHSLHIVQETPSIQETPSVKPQAVSSISTPTASKSRSVKPQEEVTQTVSTSRSTIVPQEEEQVASSFIKSRSAGVPEEEITLSVTTSRSTNIPQEEEEMATTFADIPEEKLAPEAEEVAPSMSKSRSATMPQEEMTSATLSKSTSFPQQATSSLSKSRLSFTDAVNQSKMQQTNVLEDEMSEEAQTSVEKFTLLVIDQSAEADFTPEEDEEDEDVSSEESAITDDAPAILYVRSKSAFYPPTYACHTSMTGAMAKPSSSTEDTTEQLEYQQLDGSYILGYDFQTTETEDTTEGDATDNEEMPGNMSR